MNRAIYHVVLLVVVLLLTPLTVPRAAELVTDKVDWPAFLNRHDLVFETLPDELDELPLRGPEVREILRHVHDGTAVNSLSLFAGEESPWGNG